MLLDLLFSDDPGDPLLSICHRLVVVEHLVLVDDSVLGLDLALDALLLLVRPSWPCLLDPGISNQRLDGLRLLLGLLDELFGQRCLLLGPNEVPTAVIVVLGHDSNLMSWLVVLNCLVQAHLDLAASVGYQRFILLGCRLLGQVLKRSLRFALGVCLDTLGRMQVLVVD